ncbi:N-acetylmuramoyl-L-alanine amidase, partial [Nocardia tengchongensis]
MKRSITKSGICTAVTAAAITTVAGIVPVAALAAPALPELPQKLAGKTIFLDPGHQGLNHSQDTNKQVSDGRGGTKECQTTGMTTLHGIAEHTITWNVAQLVRTSLEGLGAHVVLSRPDDTGWGGCIDERAKAANASGADVAVSIHADSGPADGHGFHLIVPQLPVADAKVNEVQSGPGLAASKAMRDTYVQSGYQVATYNGAVDGLQTRSDIAGPALTTVPDVFLEMGNGANAEDAQQLESPEGQLKHAVTITTGIASYLLGVPVPGVEKA